LYWTWYWTDGSAWQYTAWCKSADGCSGVGQPNNQYGDEYYVYGNLVGPYWGDRENEDWADDIEAFVCEYP